MPERDIANQEKAFRDIAREEAMDEVNTAIDALHAETPRPWWASRKLWAALGSSATIAAGVTGPLGLEAALAIAAPLLGYLGILGVRDVADAFRPRW